METGHRGKITTEVHRGNRHTYLVDLEFMSNGRSNKTVYNKSITFIVRLRHSIAASVV